MAFCVTQDYTYVGREQADEQVSDITHHGADGTVSVLGRDSRFNMSVRVCPRVSEIHPVLEINTSIRTLFLIVSLLLRISIK